MLFYCYKYTFLILCNEAKGASAKTLRFYWGFYWVQTQIFAGFSVLGTSSRTGSRVRSVFTLNVTGGPLGGASGPLTSLLRPPADSAVWTRVSSDHRPPVPPPQHAPCVAAGSERETRGGSGRCSGLWPGSEPGCRAWRRQACRQAEEVCGTVTEHLQLRETICYK